ncbi:MAG: hypothetical protein ACTSVD_09175 [Candidatus Thorarchaeota archaeon]
MTTGIPSVEVELHNLEGGRVSTNLRWTVHGPTTDAVREPLHDSSYTISVAVLPDVDGGSRVVPLDRPVRVLMKPILMTWRPYLKENISSDNMYPPSSDRWATRMTGRSTLALYVVQCTQDSKRLWMTVIDRNGHIHEAHTIRNYEFPMLQMEEDWLVMVNNFAALAQKRPEEVRREILSILDEKPPTWGELARIAEGIELHELKIKKTMGETLEQLVPPSFRGPVREEIKAFLAHKIRRRKRNVDVVALAFDTAGARWFKSFMTLDIQVMLEEMREPPYVKMLWEAAREGEVSWRSKDQSLARAPEIAALEKLFRVQPDWRYRAIKYARILGRQDVVSLRMPVERPQAAGSRELAKDRFALLHYGFSVKSYLNPQAVGLVGMVSLSPAFRWPHRHMAWSATLSGQVMSLKHVQYMVVPPPVVETVTREIGNTLEVDWSVGVVNKQLFNPKKNRWESKGDRIATGATRSRTIRQLRSEFGGWDGKSVWNLETNDITAIDATAANFYLAYTEMKGFERVFGSSRDDLEDVLEKLLRRRIVGIVYRPQMLRLASVLFDIEGEEANLLALVRSILRHVPAANALVGRTRKRSVVMAKVPVEEVRYYLTEFPREVEHVMHVRTARLVSFRSYQNTLLQRLHRSDGTWEDDITALLEQRHSQRHLRAPAGIEDIR